tara:strand:- start:1532 stop:2935 length:1404 start_codon:yes stop_codon:yes gene_type:complete
MSTIREQQLNLLKASGEERILFKRYDKDGNHISNDEENVLLTVPNVLIPLNKNLTVEYERPLKEVHYVTKRDSGADNHPNTHFMYSRTNTNKCYKWNVGLNDSSGEEDSNNTVKVVEFGVTTGLDVHPLSKNKMLRTLGFLTSRSVSVINTSGGAMFNSAFQITQESTTNINSLQQIPQKAATRVSFDYFITSLTDDKNIMEAEFVIQISLAWVYNTSDIGMVEWDDEDGEWKVNAYRGSFYPENNYIKVNQYNQWQTLTIDMPPYRVGSASGDNTTNYTSQTVGINIGVSQPILTSPSGASNFTDNYQGLLVDNVSIKSIPRTKPTQTTITRNNGNSVHTGVKKIESILTNVHKRSFSDHRILESLVQRRLPNSIVALENIVGQEILNDFRAFLERFRGTFYNANPQPIPVSFHNRIWVNFINEQEPVSGMIDKLTYNVKSNRYDIEFHLPNQDDNVSADYIIKFE